MLSHFYDLGGEIKIYLFQMQIKMILVCFLLVKCFLGAKRFFNLHSL